MEIICERVKGMLLLCFLLKLLFCCVLLLSVISCLSFFPLPPAHCLESRKLDCERNFGVSTLAQWSLLLGLSSTLTELPSGLPLPWMFPRVCVGTACTGFSAKRHVMHWDNVSVLNVCIGLAVWAQQTGLGVFSKVQH